MCGLIDLIHYELSMPEEGRKANGLNHLALNGRAVKLLSKTANLKMSYCVVFESASSGANMQAITSGLCIIVIAPNR
jgi:hypothetical protein